jgi:hypothetical protein
VGQRVVIRVVGVVIHGISSHGEANRVRWVCLVAEQRSRGIRRRWGRCPVRMRPGTVVRLGLGTFRVTCYQGRTSWVRVAVWRGEIYAYGWVGSLQLFAL